MENTGEVTWWLEDTGGVTETEGGAELKGVAKRGDVRRRHGLQHVHTDFRVLPVTV